MELLALAIIWPLLFLGVGFAFISLGDIGQFSFLPAILLLVVFIAAIRSHPPAGGKLTQFEELQNMRGKLIGFSIALFLPIFAKYMIEVADENLASVILGLVLGFGVLAWGIFVRGSQVLRYGNVFGGALVIIYMYFQLWGLGEVAQIAGAAFGLVVAVIIAALRFREKLQ